VFPKRDLPVETFKDCDVCPEMVQIPAGSFMMGSPASESKRDGEESPFHRVTIRKPFAVGKFEVTQAEWRSIMGANPSRFKGDRKPVERVSWDDVQTFVGKLSAKTKKHYRLLSEAEWEYAARAGTTTPFHTGVTITTNQANFNSKKGTVAVGTFLANAFGLHDMHGNVLEWVGDCWNGTYRGAPSDGSVMRTGDCSRHALRGGSWFSDSPVRIRSASRYGFLTISRGDLLGFRVARDLI